MIDLLFSLWRKAYLLPHIPFKDLNYLNKDKSGCWSEGKKTIPTNRTNECHHQ